MFYKICSKISKNVLDFKFLFTYSKCLCFQICSGFSKLFSDSCFIKLLTNSKNVHVFEKHLGNSKFVCDIIKLFAFVKKIRTFKNVIKIWKIVKNFFQTVLSLILLQFL